MQIDIKKNEKIAKKYYCLRPKIGICASKYSKILKKKKKILGRMNLYL